MTSIYLKKQLQTFKFIKTYLGCRDDRIYIYIVYTMILQKQQADIVVYVTVFTTFKPSTYEWQEPCRCEPGSSVNHTSSKPSITEAEGLPPVAWVSAKSQCQGLTTPHLIQSLSINITCTCEIERKTMQMEELVEDAKLWCI